MADVIDFNEFIKDKELAEQGWWSRLNENERDLKVCPDLFVNNVLIKDCSNSKPIFYILNNEIIDRFLSTGISDKIYFSSLKMIDYLLKNKGSFGSDYPTDTA